MAYATVMPVDAPQQNKHNRLLSDEWENDAVYAGWRFDPGGRSYQEHPGWILMLVGCSTTMRIHSSNQ
jgi:hypothetical protein